MGIIETRGYTPLVTAVDGAIKAARVTLESKTLVGGGLSTATVTGDVGAVKAAMSAAEAIIAGLGATGMTHVIARPDSAVWAMLDKDGLKVGDGTPEGPAPGGGPSQEPKTPAADSSGTEALTVAPEAGLPAVREEAEVPAERPEAGVPATRESAKVPAAAGGYDQYPAVKPKKTVAGEKAKAKKKPNKPSNKK